MTTEHEDRTELAEAMLDPAEEQAEIEGVTVNRWGRFIVFTVNEGDMAEGMAREVFAALRMMIAMIGNAGEGGTGNGSQ